MQGLRQERYVDAGNGVVEATVNVETLLESEAAKNGEAHLAVIGTRSADVVSLYSRQRYGAPEPHLAVIGTRCADVVSRREKTRGEISLVDY